MADNFPPGVVWFPGNMVLVGKTVILQVSWEVDIDSFKSNAIAGNEGR